jgi:hypothetical protein
MNNLRKKIMKMDAAPSNAEQVAHWVWGLSYVLESTGRNCLEVARGLEKYRREALEYKKNGDDKSAIKLFNKLSKIPIMKELNLNPNNIV